MARPARLLARLTLTALILALASPAHADSFLTSVSTGSKTAARVGPAPYASASITPREARFVARKGLTVIRSTKNIAIGLDVIQRVDSVAMDAPEVGREFQRGLAKLAKTGDPVYRLLNGANRALRSPKSRSAAEAVRQAAKALPKDSAAQLVAGLSLGQRLAFGFNNWDQPSKLSHEAARLLNQAQRLEKKTAHPRPLVRAGLKQAKEYAAYYGAFNGLIK